MRRAALTGLVTGVIISAILICGTYVRRFLPSTFTANLLFLTLFFGSIVTVLWLSLNYYSKTSVLKWKSLGIPGIISSIIAALLVSIHSFMYSKFSGPSYLNEIMQLSKQKWENTNSAAESLIGSWFQRPVNSAWYTFRDLMLLLFLISVVITIVFYLLNRNRTPDQKENHELIF